MSTDDPVWKRWDGKLRNWALWITGSESKGVGSAYDGEHGECAPRQPLPLVGEALDTDDLVQRLSIEHNEAVQAVYVWTGTMLERAGYIGIQPRTLNDRCDAAMLRLDVFDRARALGTTRPPVKSVA